MNKGQAFYRGERVVFSAVVLNPHSRQPEYLVVYEGEARWVRQVELSHVVYWVA